MAHNDNTQGLAQIYAGALYDVAVQQGIAEQVEHEVLAMNTALKTDERFGRFLDSPVIEFEAKRKVLQEALRDFAAPVRNFMCILARRQRLELLGAIVHEFHDHCNEAAGVAEFDVVSARELEPDERARLKAALAARMGRTVVLREEVRPRLVCGMILKREDQHWDGTAVRRLRTVVAKMGEVKATAGMWTEGE